MEISARLANPPVELVDKYSRKEREFFFDYAAYVLQLYNNPNIKELLLQLMQLENIRAMKAVDLRVMIFPARPLHGRLRSTLHGSYNQDTAQISIYPLKIRRDWIRGEGFDLFKSRPQELSWAQRKNLREAYESAVSTLIHEVLHVKFEDRNLLRYSEEAIVRKLEKQYLQQWMSKLPANFEETLVPVSSTTVW